MNVRISGLGIIGFFTSLALLLTAPASFAHSGKYAGWERGGKYDQLYDASELDSFKGRVVDVVEIIPFPGMAPGVGLIVEDKNDRQKETVHLGPKGFVNLDSIGLRVGDMVKVRGVWAEIDGNDVVLANKVKKEQDQIKVRRTKDGYPYWEMSPEDVKKELGEE
ncbi:hypothetical protein [Desulfovibrio inopinatus]|uniref:hypothetical protein n=1 Tax=Desulfovibrio inopinatus TaxID=102109 RepID=UPI00041B9953|nr:hypothetical protein [Desulfovibrio inopinatus]